MRTTRTDFWRDCRLVLSGMAFFAIAASNDAHMKESEEWKQLRAAEIFKIIAPDVLHNDAEFAGMIIRGFAEVKAKQDKAYRAMLTIPPGMRTADREEPK